MKLRTLAAIVLAITLVGSESYSAQLRQTKRKKYRTRQVVVEKVVERVIERPFIIYKTEKILVKKNQNKNRLSLLVGVGPNRLESTSSSVRMEVGPVFGMQYQRTIKEDVSVGLQLQNNRTVLGIIGIDF
jgi:Tfp pilus assembly protein PilE